MIEDYHDEQFKVKKKYKASDLKQKVSGEREQ